MIVLDRFDRITLSKRVIALAASAILGFLTIGLVQFWSDKTIETTSLQSEVTDEAYSKLNTLQRLALNLRVAEQKLRAERRATNLPAVETAVADLEAQTALLDKLSGQTETRSKLTADIDAYLNALKHYSGILAQLGYRDRQSIEVTEDGQAGIDSPTGFTVELSNAVAKMAARISEELEFDDQPAVFKVNSAFEGIRRDILMLVSDADQSYVTLIEQKSAHLRQLLASEDLDPDFAETSNALLEAVQRHLDNLGTAELALAETGAVINQSYQALEQNLSGLLRATLSTANEIRTLLDDQRSFYFGLVFTVIVCTLAALIATSFLIVRSVAQNLSTITGVTTELAQGQIDCQIPYTALKTEIGELARALLVFQENARQRHRLEAEAQAENAAKTAHQAEIDAAIAAFKTDIVNLLSKANGTISEARHTADELLQTNDRNDLQAGSANEAAALASTNVQTVAAATQQLNQSIQEISAQISSTSSQVEKVSQSTETTNRNVDELAQAAVKIDEIIVLIQAIAAQTNLLALNATIEAARAGEHGRGFAIVASEVKSLANQTASATEEISNQIKAVQQSSQSTVAAMAEITAIISEVQNNTVTISGSVEEQTAATAEISRNVHEAAKRTRHVADTVSILQATTADAKNSAGRIRNASADVGDINDRVKARIDDFLKKVAVA